MKNFHNKGLTYYCNQNINDLETIDGSLHCNLCSKKITDFRNKTKEQYLKIISNDKNSCGIFYREQVQKELKLPRLIINSISIFTATYLLLISTPLKSQNNPSETEQVDPTTSEQEKITPIQKDSTKTNKQPNTKSCNKKQKEYKRRKKIYFNRNFPFIHYGYNYLLGFRSPSIDWIKK